MRPRNGTLEGQGGHEVSGIQRAAACQHIDQLEVCEGKQHREGHGDRNDGCEQWQGDVPKLLPRRGTINGGRLIVRRRDGLQTCQQGNGHKGNAAPDVG